MATVISQPSITVTILSATFQDTGDDGETIIVDPPSPPPPPGSDLRKVQWKGGTYIESGMGKVSYRGGIYTETA